MLENLTKLDCVHLRVLQLRGEELHGGHLLVLVSMRHVPRCVITVGQVGRVEGCHHGRVDVRGRGVTMERRG